MIKNIRPPAAAGSFYPADAATLRTMVLDLLHAARSEGPLPKALIAPHAGYIYSGPVAASGYALLEPTGQRIERVVLVGPSHRVPFHGLAATEADEFATPLGSVPIDRAGVERVGQLPQVQMLEAAHQQEHSLEVQLPFLQTVLPDFSLVPLVIGQTDASEVEQVLDLLWSDDRTLVVASSDLSHYLDYYTATAVDRETSELIESLDWQTLRSERACGYLGIAGLLKLARRRGLRARCVDLRNSGDTAGPKDQVVGYGSYVIF